MSSRWPFCCSGRRACSAKPSSNGFESRAVRKSQGEKHLFYREAGQFKTTYAADMAIFPIRQDRIGLGLILLVAFVAIPATGDQFLLNSMLIPFLILSLAAIGLNILTGYTGLLSLGSAGFMGVGAYACYKLDTYFPQVNVLVWILVSGLFSSEVGGHTLFGLPITGPNATPSTRYLVALSITTALAWIASNITHGRIGRMWMAVRDMDIAAELIGIRLLRAKLLAFAVSSFYVGVAGAMMVYLWLGAAEPEAFSIDLSFQLLFMVIIGGLGSIVGAFFGAVVIQLLPIVLRALPASLGLNIAAATIEHLTFM